ncbi:MAG TPA: hypothetical protein VIL68_11530 [Propionibacteriaceae bacterium]
MILAALIGCQAQTEYRVFLGAALSNGVSPVEAKEVDHYAGDPVLSRLAGAGGDHVLLDALSQLVPYIGYPRTLNGLAAINEIAPAEG